MTALWTRMMIWFDRDERGQGTVEYILVVLAVVAVATVLVQWVEEGIGRQSPRIHLPQGA